MIARLPSLSPAERWATLGLVGAAVLAGFVLTEPLGVGAADGTGAVLARPLPIGSGSDGFTARPPFDPERRALEGVGSLPSNAPPPAADPGPAPEPPLRLAGILADGGTHKALFAGVEGWQGPGAVVAGWTIDGIETRRVTLHRGEERRVLDASDALR